MKNNVVGWFEIPVTDMNRALKFYCTIFNAEMTAQEAMPGFTMAMFPAQDGVGGAIVQGQGYSPSNAGTVVYLNGGDNLNTVLEKVEDANGEVIMPKTGIGENGFIAYFADTEGNKVGLHSMG